ncbi:D-alanine--D-alanine ligase family protein [Candidatus Neptunochlamydia vexilliferae]|uniref:D-alanine--D-alanine ligase family protein n=1 Tax=Candidatus Neptunichlamydia vexilliferae TaxID=1651774 RepID=UPI0018910E87|nr:D-alanine--D-alanine ligase family protein [Candidatus Neptunochlamydia vexilliferae]
MQTKIRIGILFGGQSPEHEVSILSAESVMDHLDPEKYEVLPIKIDKKGRWEKEIFSPCALRAAFDVVFPVLHGPYGEDGTVQGLLELANIPYVGPDQLSSVLCMDKGVTKELLSAAGLPTPQYQIFRVGDPIDMLPFPLFVKPAQMGSSVGVSKVSDREALASAIEEAFKYSETILIEEGIEGKEIECSVMGNTDPIASLPGEVIPTHEFYSYEAKYLDENGAHFVLPAELSSEKREEVQRLAIAAFKALRCEGMARVDFFLKKDGTLLINELNTIPGFTTISLYPKLWEVSGLPYPELLDRLIELAFERHHRKKLTPIGV